MRKMTAISLIAVLACVAGRATPPAFGEDTYLYMGSYQYNYSQAYQTEFMNKEDPRIATEQIDSMTKTADKNIDTAKNTYSQKTYTLFTGIVHGMGQEPVGYAGSLFPPSELQKLVDFHNDLIANGQANNNVIRNFYNPAVANISAITDRHGNATAFYLNHYRHYAQVTANEMKARAESAKHASIGTIPAPSNPIDYPSDSVPTVSPDASSLKRSLVSLYECAKVRKGRWGYWIMDGPRKGQFVTVTDVNNNACLQGFCTCEAIF